VYKVLARKASGQDDGCCSETKLGVAMSVVSPAYKALVPRLSTQPIRRWQ
jgi:hypothetical protein